jgi:Ca-activated chloride channel family protein
VYKSVNFGFDRPILAVMAVIVIPLAVFLLSRLKNPFIAAIPLGAPGGIPFKAPQMEGLVRFLKVLEIFGIFLLFIGAAGPVTKTNETVWLNRGADIIFILDTSPSMAALDMDGKNRYTAARNLLVDFAERRPSDNIGLVAVGSDAALLIPPTADREALKIRLEQLKIGEFGDGTALGMGLAVAVYHLNKSNAKRKVAVLITDGENNAGVIHPETAASMLGEMGVSLWVIGLGSMGEVPIDYTDPYTMVRRIGTFDSRFSTESLRRLSFAGGGTYIAAPSADAFSTAFSRLDDGEMTVQRSRLIHKRRSISLYFLVSAACLLGIVRFVRRNLLGAVI